MQAVAAVIISGIRATVVAVAALKRTQPRKRRQTVATRITRVNTVRAVAADAVVRLITAYKRTKKKSGGENRRSDFYKSGFFRLKKLENVHTYIMKKLRETYRFLRKKYELLTFKKYTTLAGTLVFFLIMSIVPLSFWLTLIIGKLPIDTEEILHLPVFASVKNVLLYVQKEAANAAASVSVLLLVTTLYSSTNLFYQMRRSGEIIYDYHRPKQGLRLRVGALVLMFIIMFVVVAFVVLFALGTFLFSRFLSDFWERVADYVLLAALAFALVLLLNMYICPHKAPVKKFLLGTGLTVGGWAIAVVGFAIYLKISNMDKLYGALSAIIVFMLWLYLLMLGFIVGVIFNSEKIERHLKKEKEVKKRKNLAHNRQRKAHTVGMKSVKLKSSLLAGLTALLLFFPNLTNGSLKDITKPYLGEYECKSATLGEQEFLDEFSLIKLELKSDETFLLHYQPKDGAKKTETGKYKYDKDKQEICFSLDRNSALKRKFPLKKGIITIDFKLGTKQLIMKFEQN